MNSAQLLQRMPLEDRQKRVANIILDSSYRIKGLIDNVMDFASGRLGGGIQLNYDDNRTLVQVLTHVVRELETIWPGRTIEMYFDLIEKVSFDGKRIAQLFSNLLANALTHGKTDSVVKVQAISIGGIFKLSVANSGEKISKTDMERLFQPFYRGNVKQGKQGLGLGLYISAEIAKAHRGKLEVLSDDKETAFTLLMPVGRTGGPN